MIWRSKWFQVNKLESDFPISSWWANECLKHHSVIFDTRYFCREDREDSRSRPSRNTWRFCQQCLQQCLLYIKTGPNQVRNVITPPLPGQPLGHFPVGVASRTRVVNLFWAILDTWPSHCSWDLWSWRNTSIFKDFRIIQLLNFLRIVISCVTHGWAEGRIASTLVSKKKPASHLAYLSILMFLWFSVSCCFLGFSEYFPFI